MRLLHVQSLTFTEFLDEKRPPYIIASHRWLEGEVTFQDVRDGRNTNLQGYRKVEAFARYIRQHLPQIEWLWIDTCCIDKKSAAELSEAINCMFEWYRTAKLCLAYLADVNTAESPSSFEQSVWFKRGWTLQELLAPQTVVFLTEGWQVIGHKGVAIPGDHGLSTGPDLGESIARITGIPEQVLHDFEASSSFTVNEKLKWMKDRTTTRPEDKSYALYGILGVTLGANYGEGDLGAQQRLLAAIHQRDTLATQQAEEFQSIVGWLSPPDPWTNHESARRHHEPQTGTWLLQDPGYQAWKSGKSKFLWLYGKAGCGKTVLCSTAIKDVQTHCLNTPRAEQAVFYFTFSDDKKQTFESLVRSLIAQLGSKEPSVSMLRQAYQNRAQKPQPGVDELTNILHAAFRSHDQVYLHLDGLDECPERDGLRQHVLTQLRGLLEGAPNVQVIATSRDEADIRSLMRALGAKSVPIATPGVDADIRKYVSAEMSRDHKLSRLNLATKTLIEETLAEKADGMFRWVFCQLQELKRSKSTQPKSIQAALHALPETLDGTYERMLSKLDADDRPYALILLRWITYARRPLSLNQLADCGIVDPTDDPSSQVIVDFENRGSLEDTLAILAGLVVIGGTHDEHIGHMDADTNDDTDDSGKGQLIQRPDKDTTIRLAHFSVKEYLESPRIRASTAKYFHLNPAREHDILTLSCLGYLTEYSKSDHGSRRKESAQGDLLAFPLLEYAARTWPYHTLLGLGQCTTEVISFLESDTAKQDWLLVRNPDDFMISHFKAKPDVLVPPLYWASILGLEKVIDRMLVAGADVNAQGGAYGNALQAAAIRGSEKIVQMLLYAGADVNAQGGAHGNALQAAAYWNNEKIVQMLLDAGADVNAQGGDYGNALQAAVYKGNEKTVQMLLLAGADVNAQGGDYGNALQAAASEGNEKIVQMLLDAGASEE